MPCHTGIPGLPNPPTTLATPMEAKSTATPDQSIPVALA